MLILHRVFGDTGLFKYRMYFTWDKGGQHKNDLGWIYSNPFQIINGTPIVDK